MYLDNDYEFYKEWCNRDDDEYGIFLDDYNELRCIEKYVDDKYYNEYVDSSDPY